MRTSLFLLSLLLFVLPALSQDLPRKIRGYTVYRETVIVRNGDEAASTSTAPEVVVNVGDPELTDVALGGVSFELSADITSARQSGKVDFLSFHDFKVNGVSVEIDEYEHAFSFSKHETVKLPAPARLFLPTTQLLNAAWREMRESKKEWTVTGRVFVFGRFRRFGFHHRRVVPVDISLTIKNPLLTDPD